MIDNLGRIDPRARLFTYKTKSMYTNTSTEYALEGISKYLRDNQFEHDYYHVPTLIEASEIVTRNIILKFGNTFRKQSKEWQRERLLHQLGQQYSKGSSS